MIERKIKENIVPESSSIYPIYKILVILCLLKREQSDKGTIIGKIQLYLWGVCSTKNKQKLSQYKKNKRISDIPISLDFELPVLLTNIVLKGWVEYVYTNDNIRYKITFSGLRLLNKYKDLKLIKEIDKDLDEIGILPNTSINKINYVWTYDTL